MTFYRRKRTPLCDMQVCPSGQKTQMQMKNPFFIHFWFPDPGPPLLLICVYLSGDHRVQWQLSSLKKFAFTSKILGLRLEESFVLLLDIFYGRMLPIKKPKLIASLGI